PPLQRRLGHDHSAGDPEPDRHHHRLMAITILNSAFSETAGTTFSFGFTAGTGTVLLSFGTTRSNVLQEPGGWTVLQRGRTANNDDAVTMWKTAAGESSVTWGGGIQAHEHGIWELANADPTTWVSNTFSPGGNDTTYRGGSV